MLVVRTVCPETVVRYEVIQATSSDVLYGGNVMVVCMLKVFGGKTKVQGG